MRRKVIPGIIIAVAITGLVGVYSYSRTVYVLGQNNLVYQVKANEEKPTVSDYIDENHLNMSTPKAEDSIPAVQKAAAEQDTQPKEIVNTPAETALPKPVEADKIIDVNIPASENKGNVVLLGDSITEGLAIYGFFPEAHIIGVNSLNTITAKDQIDNVVSQNPDQLFILLGINDIWEGGQLDYFINNYRSLISDIKDRTHGCDIYIESILPVSETAMARNSEINNQIIDEANIKIKAFAQEMAVKYIDVNSNLKDEKGNLKKEYSNDGVHLINTYYSVWTDRIAYYMNN